MITPFIDYVSHTMVRFRIFRAAYLTYVPGRCLLLDANAQLRVLIILSDNSLIYYLSCCQSLTITGGDVALFFPLLYSISPSHSF